METTLITNLKIEDICNGFVYNEYEGKGLFGWSENLLFSLSTKEIIFMQMGRKTLQ